MRHVAAGFGALVCALLFCFGGAESPAADAPAQPLSSTVRFEPRPVPKAKTRTGVVIALSSSDAVPRVTAANCLCVLEVVKEANTSHVPAARYPMRASGRGAREVAANVIFPSPGAYVLELTCSPRYAGTFDAFQKTFRTKVSP